MASESSIVVKISADLSELSSKLEDGAAEVQRGSEKLKESAKSAEESFKSLCETVDSLAEDFGVFETIDWAKNAIGEALELGEHLKNTSEIAGVSTGELQELKFAADATGTSFERIVQIVQRAASALNELRSGSASGALVGAMKALHLKPEDLADTQHLMVKIAAGLNEIHDAGLRIAALKGLFGDMGAEALPMLERLRELRDEFESLGIVLDESAIEKLDQTKEEFNKLSSVWQIVKAQITADLTPALESVTRLLIALAKQVNESAKSGALQEFGRQLAMSILEGARAINDGLGPALRNLNQELGDAETRIEHIMHPFASIAELGADLAQLGMYGGTFIDPEVSREVFEIIAGIEPQITKTTEAVTGLDATIDQMEAKLASHPHHGDLADLAIATHAHSGASSIGVRPPADENLQKQIEGIEDQTKAQIAAMAP